MVKLGQWGYEELGIMKDESILWILNNGADPKLTARSDGMNAIDLARKSSQDELYEKFCNICGIENKINTKMKLSGDACDEDVDCGKYDEKGSKSLSKIDVNKIADAIFDKMKPQFTEQTEELGEQLSDVVTAVVVTTLGDDVMTMIHGIE